MCKMKLILTDSLIVETLPLPDNRACNLILSVSIKNLYSNFTFFKTVLLEIDDEFSRWEAVVVLQKEK